MKEKEGGSDEAKWLPGDYILVRLRKFTFYIEYGEC